MAPAEARSSARSPTGQQWRIGHGRQEVIVTEVGATLRSFTVDGAPVIDGFGLDEWSHSGRGQVLAPWPNRLGDGRYEFGGVTAQAPLNEPATGNAIHGLVRWLPFAVEARAQNVVVLVCTVYPSPAYPYMVELRIEYRIGRDGLVVTSTVTNVGPDTLPFGLGFHPYLTVGTPVDTAVLRLPGQDRAVLDHRGLPTGEVRPVAGTEFDFTVPRAVGPTRMDVAYTALARDGQGLAWASLEDPGTSRALDLWVDDRFSWLMCFTGDTLPDPARRRRAVAVEPMSCPPDALRSGRDLVVLEPGLSWMAAWGLRVR